MRGFLRGIKPRSLEELKLIMQQDKLNVTKEKLKVDVEIAQIGARATKYAANVRASGVLVQGYCLPIQLINILSLLKTH